MRYHRKPMPPLAAAPIAPHVRPLDPVLEFLRLLWSIEHGLQRRSKKMESELGITGPQRLVLRVVGRYPDLSPGDLAQTLKLHPSTITGILQRLVSKGLIERRRDPTDTRRARLRLKRGAARHTKVTRGTIEQAVTAALKDAGPRNVRVGRQLLAEIARRMNALE